MQNLLFVDDEKSYLKGMERMLHQWKNEWRILTAPDVDQALALTRENEFDVIISDVKMPGKSVFDLLSALQYAATIAMTHHERWDGSGYPRGLKQSQIPIQGRIVALADVYDALRSKRPYKEPYSAKDDWQTIQQQSGVHFDPDLVDAIKKLQKKFESIRTRYNDQ